MMNGQGSHPNSSLGNFFVDERLETNNRGLVQHNVVPANVSVCEQVPANPAVFDGSMLIGRIGQSRTTMNTQNQVSSQISQQSCMWFLPQVVL